MSLINQMLQDLEQRRADGGAPTAKVRAVARPAGASAMRWGALGLILLMVAAGAGYWFAAYRPGPPRASTPAAPVVAAPVPAPVTAPAPPTMPSVLQLASELSQLPREPAPQTVSEAPPPKAPEKPPAETPRPVKAAEAPPAPTHIERDIKQTSPQQRAENAYRTAYNALQQGRMNEAGDNLRQALQYDPRHAPARQALAALLVEGGRLNEAEQLMRQGLELQPANTGFAMTLARLQVERGDTPTALATLQRHPPSDETAEYHGFLAALLQRSERHKEAIEQYQAALRLSPSVGPWLLGLGISFQADNQPAKAADAFRRARQGSGLSPELQAFAEQRLKQFQ